MADSNPPQECLQEFDECHADPSAYYLKKMPLPSSFVYVMDSIPDADKMAGTLSTHNDKGGNALEYASKDKKKELNTSRQSIQEVQAHCFRIPKHRIQLAGAPGDTPIFDSCTDFAATLRAGSLPATSVFSVAHYQFDTLECTTQALHHAAPGMCVPFKNGLTPPEWVYDESSKKTKVAHCCEVTVALHIQKLGWAGTIGAGTGAIAEAYGVVAPMTFFAGNEQVATSYPQ